MPQYLMVTLSVLGQIMLAASKEDEGGGCGATGEQKYSGRIEVEER